MFYMENTTFIHHGTEYIIIEVKEHNADFTNQLGWTHYAKVTRVNGRKPYLANLIIVDGEVGVSRVIV